MRNAGRDDTAFCHYPIELEIGEIFRMTSQATTFDSNILNCAYKAIHPISFLDSDRVTKCFGADLDDLRW